MRTSRLFGSIVLCPALLLGGVACDDDEESAPPIDLTAPPSAEPQGVYGNSLSSQALTRNALIANPIANPVMITAPLATSSYADGSSYPELRYQLHHGPTREVMSYLVSCVLEPGQSVSYHDTFTGADYTFPGELGLCPSWAAGAASATCQELAAACLLTRVNALGKKITLSMRGEVPGAAPGSGPTDLLYPASTVRTVNYRETSDTIASFKACALVIGGASRDCGWKADAVGKCTPGERVYIGAGAKPAAKCLDTAFPVLGSSTGNTVLRVCEGIAGCNSGSPNAIAESGGSCSTARPAIAFTCPSSGYFNVMSGPQLSNGVGVASPAVRTQGGTVYPASEQEVFTWQEGAFYGNLWGVGALHPLLAPGMNRVTSNGVFHPAPAASGAVYRRAFACTGRFWTHQEAYMRDRVCAGSTVDCAATPVGACNVSNDNIPSCPPVHRCSILDGNVVTGDGDFQECAGSVGTWQNPISVYLNGPRDIVSDPDNSETMGTPSAPGAPLCP